MIVKKKYAKAASQAKKKPPSQGLDVLTPAQQEEMLETRVDPEYEGSISDEDFESGRLKDRRARDRRMGFRRKEDQMLISRAQDEANAIRENAQKQGFQEGLEQSQGVVDELAQAMDALLNAKEQALLAAADELAPMAMEIAKKIMHVEVSCDDALVLDIVRKTIAKVGRDQKFIEVKVNPVDVNVVRENLEADSPVARDVEIVVSDDDSVDQGSCMVETRSGLIDARFSTQLEVLEKLITTGEKT